MTIPSPSAARVARLPAREGRNRMTVNALFDRGLRRSRGRWLGVPGELCTDENGLGSQFSLEISEGIVRQAAFRATTCVTLIAYCELLVGWVTGMPLEDAIRLSATQLAGALREVPPAKRGRAVLPVRALRSAIQRAALDDAALSSPPERRVR